MEIQYTVYHPGELSDEKLKPDIQTKLISSNFTLEDDTPHFKGVFCLNITSTTQIQVTLSYSHQSPGILWNLWHIFTTGLSALVAAVAGLMFDRPRSSAYDAVNGLLWCQFFLAVLQVIFVVVLDISHAPNTIGFNILCVGPALFKMVLVIQACFMNGESYGRIFHKCLMRRSFGCVLLALTFTSGTLLCYEPVIARSSYAGYCAWFTFYVVDVIIDWILSMSFIFVENPFEDDDRDKAKFLLYHVPSWSTAFSSLLKIVLISVPLGMAMHNFGTLTPCYEMVASQAPKIWILALVSGTLSQLVSIICMLWALKVLHFPLDPHIEAHELAEMAPDGGTIEGILSSMG